MQAIFGTTAVIMPGSILGKGALVGAIAATDIGQELAGDTLYMGAPAMATNKHDSGAALCCMTHQDPCEVPQMPCNALSRLPTAACLLCAKLHLAEARAGIIGSQDWSHAFATEARAEICYCCA